MDGWADLELLVGDPTSLLTGEPASPLAAGPRRLSIEPRDDDVRGSTAPAAAAFASSTAHRLLASCAVRERVRVGVGVWARARSGLGPGLARHVQVVPIIIVS